MKILDTDIISVMLRKSPHPSLVYWFARQNTGELTLSAPTIAEIRFGQARLSAGDPRAAALDTWLGQLSTKYTILSLSAAAADYWGLMLATPALQNFYRAQPNQKRPSFGMDLMIAAIGLANDATVVTRNAADFRQIAACFPSLQVENPFKVQETS